MSLSQTRLVPVAIDDGYDYTKVVTANATARIPTSYTLKPDPKVVVMGRDEDVERIYEINGKQIAVGQNIKSGETRFEEFPYHEANLAVAIDAIRRVVEPGTKVHAIAGVPLDRYYLPNGEHDTGVLPKKQLAWNRPVKCLNDNAALPQICKISLISEAVAAWFDYVIDADMEFRDNYTDFMAVVDIGGRTTDIAVFESGIINMSLSGTIDHGVLNIQQRVKHALAKQFRGTQFSRAALNRGVESGKVPMGSGDFDVTKDVIEERHALISEVEVFMNSKFGSQLPLMKRILFVGGGAQVLQLDLKERFKSVAEFSSDPQMANARGMYKYGIKVCGLGEEELPVAI